MERENETMLWEGVKLDPVRENTQIRACLRTEDFVVGRDIDLT